MPSVKQHNDSKLSGEVDTSEGRSTLQEDLNKLEEWTNKNPVKLHRINVRYCTLENIIKEYSTRLGSTWLGSSSVESYLDQTTGCWAASIRAAEVKESLFHSELVRSHLEYCISFGPDSTKRCWRRRLHPEKGPRDDQRTGKPAV